MRESHSLPVWTRSEVDHHRRDDPLRLVVGWAWQGQAWPLLVAPAVLPAWPPAAASRSPVASVEWASPALQDWDAPKTSHWLQGAQEPVWPETLPDVLVVI